MSNESGPLVPDNGDLPFAAETIVTWQAPPIKFGAGATGEVGHDAAALGLRSVLLVTDPYLSQTGLPKRVASLIGARGIAVEIFEGAEVEPTDAGCSEAALATAGLAADGYVAVGGGSSIDTAKLLNLLHSFPEAALGRYLNRPVGAGEPVPGPLKPLIAIPTTSGTGSECTSMVALEITAERVKTGIADRRLQPTLAVVDPLNTVSMSAAVTAASGYDVLCHACESYTARPYDRRPRYASAAERPIYVGANPISDVWAERTLELVGKYFRRAVLNGDDLDARTGMSLAALQAGLGFGNAGTHIPHACAYPIAGRVRDYVPSGYPTSHPMVPHGQAVVVTAPAAFSFTYRADPERHHRAAELLGGVGGGPDALPEAIRSIVRDTGGPLTLAGLGYTETDIPALIEGTVKQQRLLSCCPRPVSETDLRRVFRDSVGC
ncbi:MAG: iron-containing alcohol dehydrogenase [Nocardiopsaceae bacterium]|nr:iron-containing alcohol dehydrogenase [Nocardiopsaceae bacterium]